ncbi:PR-1-like protein, partial [Lentithecium fluviatile CBS 122367]
PSLKWSNDLASQAQAWANHLADIGDLQHDPNAGAGENLFGGSGAEYSFSDAVDSWVNEKANYHGENIPDGDFASYGHYTQVIWPETTQVGMASATGSNGWTYIVGRYLSSGN